MDIKRSLILLVVMAGVTYLVRMLPLAFFRRQIKNRFFRSFLYYVTYAVLGAMTFPAIFFCTGSVVSGIAGTAVALILAFAGRSLLTVAVSACAAAFAANIILLYI